jgi:hypothetical protein
MIELAEDAQFARDLAAGGVFVPGCALRIAEECDLVVRGAQGQISVLARVVYVEDDRGAGLELIGFSPEVKARLAALEPAGPPELEFIEEPELEGAALDRAMPDEPVAPDDGAAQGAVPEPVQLVELEALDDSGDGDFSLPAAADDDGDDMNAADTLAIYANLVNADTLPRQGGEEREDGEDAREPLHDGETTNRPDGDAS